VDSSAEHHFDVWHKVDKPYNQSPVLLFEFKAIVHTIEPDDGNHFKEHQTQQCEASCGVGVKKLKPVKATLEDISRIEKK